MPEAANEKNLLKFYDWAEKLAPLAISRASAENIFTPEELVQDFMANFIQRGFAEKFDPQVQKIESYVLTGLKRIIIDKKRKKDDEKLKSREALAAEVGSEEGAAFTEPVSNRDMNDQQKFFWELVDEIDDFPFGYGKEAEILDGEGKLIEKLPSSAKSVLKMLAWGFGPTEIAQKFGVSAGTAMNVIGKIKLNARELHPEEVVEAYFPKEDALLSDLLEDMF